MKVFYSWQEDTDTRICKNVIQVALEQAACEVASEIEIDHDTKRVLGSQNIVLVIAEKIRNCTVFVADVTLTGKTIKTNGEKKQINSNVAVELGFALGTGGEKILVKVMNEHFGTREELPFDVRDRHPVCYSLAPGASKPDLRSQRTALVKEFRGIIKAHYDQWLEEKEDKPVAISRTPFTIHPAAYWRDDEALLDVSNDYSHKKTYLQYQKKQPLAYLRINPNLPIDKLSNGELQNIIGSVSPFIVPQTCGLTWERNRFGSISMVVMDDETQGSSTQLFRSREIWGVASIAFSKGEDGEYFLPCELFKEQFARILYLYSEVAKKLGYTEAVVEAGLVNASGIKCYSGSTGRVFYNDVVHTATFDIDNEGERSKFVGNFFELVRDEAGH